MSRRKLFESSEPSSRSLGIGPAYVSVEGCASIGGVPAVCSRPVVIMRGRSEVGYFLPARCWRQRDDDPLAACRRPAVGRGRVPGRGYPAGGAGIQCDAPAHRAAFTALSGAGHGGATRWPRAAPVAPGHARRVCRSTPCVDGASPTLTGDARTFAHHQGPGLSTTSSNRCHCASLSAALACSTRCTWKRPSASRSERSSAWNSPSSQPCAAHTCAG